ncbi:MAG: glutamate synthase subunit beta [Leptospirales bacterium]
MGKQGKFMNTDRVTPSYKAVEERIKGFNEFLIPLKKEEVQEQGARCMDCGTPFCHPSCPLHNLIPEFNDNVCNNKWEEAYNNLIWTNSFPEFTGRICPAPCESGCVLGLIKDPVTIKNVEYSIIERAFSSGLVKPQPPKERSGKKVAVVGSGPAGLAAADQLNKAGHEVTLYERADRIGGLLQYGIPNFKLEKNIIDRRVDVMKAEGITFTTNANIGVDIAIEKLQKENDAVVLTCGSTIPRDLPIPGRDANGVHFAMEFLTQSTKRVHGDDIPKDEIIFAKDKHVLVIGGGDTGSDCVGTSIRQGAASVTQIELMPKPAEGRTDQTPWPTHPGPRMFSTSSSQQEGCEREWSILSKEFVKDDSGKLIGVKAVSIEWKPDNSFTEIEGTEKTYQVDLAFLAMGFLHPDHGGPVAELSLDTDKRGNVATDQQYRTSVDGVFAAGDMRRGQSLVVWAISEGRECARAVDSYLIGGVSRLATKAK